MDLLKYKNWADNLSDFHKHPTIDKAADKALQAFNIRPGKATGENVSLAAALTPATIGNWFEGEYTEEEIKGFISMYINKTSFDPNLKEEFLKILQEEGLDGVPKIYEKVIKELELNEDERKYIDEPYYYPSNNKINVLQLILEKSLIL